MTDPEPTNRQPSTNPQPPKDTEQMTTEPLTPDAESMQRLRAWPDHQAIAMRPRIPLAPEPPKHTSPVSLETADGVRVETFLRGDGDRVVNVLQYDEAREVWQKVAYTIVITPRSLL